MSNLDRSPSLHTCGGLAGVAAKPVNEVFEGREVVLGESTKVRRLLPNLGRRLVGPWCFVDHYGPDDVASEPGMQVPPHPHIGLQTVSWLIEGEIHHRDSIGSDALLRPGQLGLMTSGNGITHAEVSPVPHPSLLHGVQLWVALPESHRHAAPSWQYHPALPIHRDSDATITVVMGDLFDTSSPGLTYSPIVGAEIVLGPGGELLLPLEPDFEHGVLVLSGSAVVDDTRLAPGAMLYLGCARRSLRFTSEDGARLMLLGGEPFEEQIVMWWNFVARSNDEIIAARTSWTESTAQFGDVDGFDGFRLPAPDLPPGQLKPGGAVRH